MKHNLKTINQAIRKANTGRGTFQDIANELEAFHKELQQLKQELLSRGNRGDVSKAELIDEILGETQQ